MTARTLIEKYLRPLARMNFASRLWAKDPELWSRNPADHDEISRRLGWLTVAQRMAENRGQIENFATTSVEDGFKHILLLGMGGSSLCPEVFSLVFGGADRLPSLSVLDSTDPENILSMEKSIDLARTLFIVSSKSGTTLEVLSFYRYFRKKAEQVFKRDSGSRFIAITDPGTPLETLGREAGFRKIFLNPPDIGGRYSALSYFGLVPAALIGMDLDKLLANAVVMAKACGPSQDLAESPGARLGAFLGGSAGEGKDKLTLLFSPSLKPFGFWVEQLIAESTGKERKGILPVEGESLESPEFYGQDRIFVYTKLKGEDKLDARIDSLEQAGFPVLRTELSDRYELGGEIFRWEVATAAASAIMGINAFDQPNVQESKDNTQRLIDAYRQNNKLPSQKPSAEGDGILLFSNPPAQTPVDCLKAVMATARPGDYIAINAFLPRSAETESALAKLRSNLVRNMRLAVTVGFGPRFLHSTGQFHKGGPRSGIFIQITCNDNRDIEIPEQGFSFSILKQAQALGDFEALGRRSQRLIRLHIERDLAKGLEEVAALFEAALADLRR